MLAAMNGHVLIIRELLHLAGLDLNKCDNEGNTALHLAAQAGVLKQWKISEQTKMMSVFFGL